MRDTSKKKSYKVSGYDPTTGEPMRARPVQVVHTESLSYSGTTWLNLILGCHPRALAIGPADRVRALRGGGDACRIHGEACPFWPGFFEGYDPEENFFLQLADYSGKDYLITNNLIPDGAGADLKHPDILVRRIRMVRDARAIFASWQGKYPERSVEEGIDTFLAPGMASQAAVLDPENTGVFYCRYEDVLMSKWEWLKRISEFLDLDYERSALKYWEHDIHPTSGNQGTISLLKFAQGIPVPEGYKDKKFYEEQYRRAMSDQTFQNKRWEDEITVRTRFLIELTCGEFQEKFGYQRDLYRMRKSPRMLRKLLDETPSGGAIEASLQLALSLCLEVRAKRFSKRLLDRALGKIRKCVYLAKRMIRKVIR